MGRFPTSSPGADADRGRRQMPPSVTATVTPSCERPRRLARPSRSWRRPELVADAPHVDDPARRARRRRACGGSATHATRAVRVGAERPVAPDVAQQLLAREHAVGVGRELHEQRELLLRERTRRAVRRARAARARSTASGPTSSRSPRGGQRRSTRADAREQLLVDERPHEVVVGALERANARPSSAPPSTITGQSGTRMRSSASGVAEARARPAARRAAARRGCRNARTSKPSLRSCRSRKPRMDGSGSARASAVMRATRTRARAAPDVLSRESVTSRLQPAGADDAPEQPDAEQRPRAANPTIGDDVDAERPAGRLSRRSPIRLEPISPPATISATTSRLNTRCVVLAGSRRGPCARSRPRSGRRASAP